MTTPPQQETKETKLVKRAEHKRSNLFQNAQEEQIRYQELTARNQHHQRKVD